MRCVSSRLIVALLFLAACADKDRAQLVPAAVSGGGGGDAPAGAAGASAGAAPGAGAAAGNGPSSVPGASGRGADGGAAGSSRNAGAGAAAAAGAEANSGAGAGATPGAAAGSSAGASGDSAAGAGGMSGAAAGSGAGGVMAPAAGAGAGGARAEKFCGNITTGGRVRPDFIEYWDQLTPENEGKWGTVERTRDQMNWSGLDEAYQYAKQHGIPFKQHTFVWGSQQPSWIGGLSQSEQRAEVEEWIRLYCERYPDTEMIDVVNEPPPHTTPAYMAALGGSGASGYDWIVQSFEWARQYCPNSILILNDYNTIEYANDNDHFIDIVQRIKAAGAPIDAVGVQAHAAFRMPTATVKMYLDKIASSTGLPIYVSEYDIDEANDEAQKRVMESQFQMFWSHPSVKGVTLWGYVEGQTGLPNTVLMTSDGQKRPALTWLLDFLGR